MVDTEGGILEASLVESDRVFQELDMQVAAGTLYWGEVFPAETWAFLEEDTWVEVCSATGTRVEVYSAEDTREAAVLGADN